MTDSEIATNGDASDEVAPNGLDPVLQVLAAVNGVPLTLNVAGLLVSGTVISSGKYWQAMAEGDDVVLRRLAETFGASRSDPESGPLPRFIQLSGAQIWNQPDMPIPTQGGVLWRGRISDVNGWNYGSIGKTPAADLDDN